MDKYMKEKTVDKEVVTTPFPFMVSTKSRKISRKFIIDQNLTPINPLQCGRQECPPGQSYGPIVRDIWILHFVMSGKGRVVKEGCQYVVRENEMFVIRPFENVSYTADKEDPWQYVWIGFTAKTCPAVLNERDVISAPYLKDAFLSAYYTESFDVPNASGAYEHYLCGVIWQIFGLLIQNTKKNLTPMDSYVKPAITIMTLSFRDPHLNVATIARRLHVSAEHFSRIFKSETGESPKKYLTDVRMKKAVEYLMKENATMTRVSEAVGFPDVLAFSRAFKRYYGCAPSEYARLQAKGKE